MTEITESDATAADIQPGRIVECQIWFEPDQVHRLRVVKPRETP